MDGWLKKGIPNGEDFIERIVEIFYIYIFKYLNLYILFLKTKQKFHTLNFLKFFQRKIKNQKLEFITMGGV